MGHDPINTKNCERHTIWFLNDIKQENTHQKKKIEK